MDAEWTQPRVAGAVAGTEHPVRAFLRAPLAAATYQQAVHLLLGGVLLLPYVLLGELFSQAEVGTAADSTLVVALVTLAAAIGVGVSLMPAARSVEIVAARTLLGVELPDPEPGSSRAWSVRLRSAAWYALNLLVGGLGTSMIAAGLSIAVPLLLPPYGGEHAAAVVLQLPVSADHPLAHPATGPLLAPIVVLATCYVVAGLDRLLIAVAPVALGPGPEEALAIEQRTTRRLAARAHLAQEMHDTIGHALTAACRQAEAGVRVLDTDPDVARNALDAVAEVSRRALDDLDRVMVLLHDDDTARGPAVTSGSLSEVSVLLEGVRASGHEITLETGATELGELPAVVSRTAHSVVREALTNALRHGERGPIVVRVDREPGTVVVEVVSPVAHATSPRPGGGRGLSGLSERCALLGGVLTAGPDGEVWRLRAAVPLEAREVGR